MDSVPFFYPYLYHSFLAIYSSIYLSFPLHSPCYFAFLLPSPFIYLTFSYSSSFLIPLPFRSSFPHLLGLSFSLIIQFFFLLSFTFYFNCLPLYFTLSPLIFSSYTPPPPPPPLSRPLLLLSPLVTAIKLLVSSCFSLLLFSFTS